MSNLKTKLGAIDRRSFLVGVGHVMISLPIMDFMLGPSGKAFAQTGGQIPKRFLIVVNGLSLGSSAGSRFNPTATGANWTPGTSLAPINNFTMLKPYVSVITNLGVPYNGNIMNSGPKFGVDTDFHGENEGCNRVQLTAMNANEKGASSDQALKSNLGLGAEYLHMNYVAQAKQYFGGGNAYLTQFGTTGAGIQPQKDPAQAFASMVTGITSDNSQVEAQRLFQLRQRKSVLDLVDKRRVEYLNRLISAESKTKLSDHFDRIRDLENQIDADIAATQTTTNTCKMASQPPMNLPIGSDYVGEHPIYNNVTETMGWSDETRRSKLFRDIIVMGMSCDRSRLGTFRLSHDQSFLNAKQLIGAGRGSGAAKDYHETSHGTGTLEDLSLCTAWHVNEYFMLAEALRSIPEGAGNILDNTVILLLSEGGWGRSSADANSMVAHSGDNMGILLAGKAGGLKVGTHIRANKEHPCEVILTAMKAAGYTGTSWNKISRTFSGLL